jgi:hypothetical protein
MGLRWINPFYNFVGAKRPSTRKLSGCNRGIRCQLWLRWSNLDYLAT